MAEVNPPFALQNAGATHTASNDRMMLSGLMSGQRSAGSLTSRGGVVSHAGGVFNVTQTGTASMTLNVNSGIAYVPGSEAGTQGLYCCTNDASDTVIIATAHGTLPRVDSVIVRVYDSAYSGALNQWQIEALTGTAAASPVAPTLPNNSIRLYNVSVGAAVTSISNANLADVREYVAAVGGIIVVKNQAERDALIATNGQAVIRLDSGVLEVRLSGVWHPRSQRAIVTSNQISTPPLNVLGTFVDFLSGSWAPITFNAPPSGSVRVTIGAAISNTNTATSTIWAAYRMSGAITVGADETLGLSAAGSRNYSGRARVFTGLTPGASCTVTPQWNISSGSGATCVFTGGQLTVEHLP